MDLAPGLQTSYKRKFLKIKEMEEIHESITHLVGILWNRPICRGIIICSRNLQDILKGFCSKAIIMMILVEVGGLISPVSIYMEIIPSPLTPLFHIVFSPQSR